MTSTAAHLLLHPHNANGQFGMKMPSTTGRINDLTSSASAEAILVVAAIAAHPNASEFDLTYVEYDRELSDEHAASLLAGDFKSVYLAVDDEHADQRYTRALEIAYDECEKAGVDYDGLSVADTERVREAIYERDASDPVAEMVRGSRPRLMRAPIIKNLSTYLADSGNSDLVYGDGERWDEQREGREQVLTAILGENGADVNADEVKDAIRFLISEGPQNWGEDTSLDVVWPGKLADATAQPFTQLPMAVRGRNLHFTGARISISDAGSGESAGAQLSGALTVTVTEEQPAVLDPSRDTAGYPAQALWSTWEATETSA